MGKGDNEPENPNSPSPATVSPRADTEHTARQSLKVGRSGDGRSRGTLNTDSFCIENVSGASHPSPRTLHPYGEIFLIWTSFMCTPTCGSALPAFICMRSIVAQTLPLLRLSSWLHSSTALSGKGAVFPQVRCARLSHVVYFSYCACSKYGVYLC